MVEHYPSAMVRMKRTSTRNTEEGEAVSADVSKLQLSLLCEANERIRVLETDLKTSEIARERAVTEAESLRDELSNARALLHAVGLCPQNGLSKFSNRSIQEVKRRHDELAEKNRKCSIEVISLRQQVDGLQRECDMRREALREAREFNPAYAQAFHGSSGRGTPTHSPIAASPSMPDRVRALTESGTTISPHLPVSASFLNHRRAEASSHDDHWDPPNRGIMKTPDRAHFSGSAKSRRKLELSGAGSDSSSVPSHYYTSSVKMYAQELSEEFNSRTVPRSATPNSRRAPANGTPTAAAKKGSAILTWGQASAATPTLSQPKQAAARKSVAFRIEKDSQRR